MNKKSIISGVALVILLSGAIFYIAVTRKLTIDNQDAADGQEKVYSGGDKDLINPIYSFTKDDVGDMDRAPLDSNNDGISDKKAQEMGLDANSLDTDGDGIFDVDEINKTKTDPLKADSDSDGFGDLEELRGGYDPNGPGKPE